MVMSQLFVLHVVKMNTIIAVYLAKKQCAPVQSTSPRAGSHSPFPIHVDEL